MLSVFVFVFESESVATSTQSASLSARAARAPAASRLTAACVSLSDAASPAHARSAASHSEPQYALLLPAATAQRSNAWSGPCVAGSATCSSAPSPSGSRVRASVETLKYASSNRERRTAFGNPARDPVGFFFSTPSRSSSSVAEEASSEKKTSSSRDSRNTCARATSRLSIGARSSHALTSETSCALTESRSGPRPNRGPSRASPRSCGAAPRTLRRLRATETAFFCDVVVAADPEDPDAAATRSAAHRVSRSASSSARTALARSATTLRSSPGQNRASAHDPKKYVGTALYTGASRFDASPNRPSDPPQTPPFPATSAASPPSPSSPSSVSSWSVTDARDAVETDDSREGRETKNESATPSSPATPSGRPQSVPASTRWCSSLKSAETNQRGRRTRVASVSSSALGFLSVRSAESTYGFCHARTASSHSDARASASAASAGAAAPKGTSSPPCGWYRAYRFTNAVANASAPFLAARAAASSSKDATGKSQATENTTSRDAPGGSANETHTAEYASVAFDGTSTPRFPGSEVKNSETHSPRASNARQ